MKTHHDIMTLESRVTGMLNAHIDIEQMALDLSATMSYALEEFDGVSLQHNVYRTIKSGKKGRLKRVRAGNIAAYFEPVFDNPKRKVTCLIGFALLNPSDKHDDGIENKTLSERAWDWRNMPYARIGKGGEKDLGGLVNAVFIPHHIVKPLYTFIVKTRSLLGHGAVMPKWVSDFVFQCNEKAKHKEDMRIQAINFRRIEKARKRAADAIKDITAKHESEES